ncbi:MAG: ROK family transcriptional regulator [Kosmotogaceae bacterium]
MISKLLELRTKEILNIIRERNNISRVELAKLTGLSKPTVSMIVNNLIDEGIIKENGLGSSRKTGGRRPIKLSFISDYKYVLSVDIGGTKTIIALIDLEGAIHKVDIIPSEQINTIRGIEKEIVSRLKSFLMDIENRKILSICIGVPGTVDRKKQIVKFIPSFNLEELDLKTPLERVFNIPVLIENDVTLAAYGESWIGSAKNYEDALLVSIGTGVGAGIVMGNVVYKGYTGSAGEIGEMITDWSSEFKRISSFGKLEEWFSGYSLEDFCIEKGMEKNLPVLFEKMKDDENINKRIIEGCVHLALAFANSIILLDPAKIIIGGGIGFNQYEQIFPIINETLVKALPKAIYRSDILDKAALEPYSVVIGGAYFAQKELLLGSICNIFNKKMEVQK